MVGGGSALTEGYVSQTNQNRPDHRGGAAALNCTRMLNVNVAPILSGRLGKTRRVYYHLMRRLTALPSFSALFYLTVWFITNVTITIYSKALFKDFAFPYPLLLTAIHLGFTWIMALTVSWLKKRKAPSDATTSSSSSSTATAPQASAYLRSILVFSLVFTINIWLSNYSLLVVTISVHQILRTTIPLFTMLFSWLLFQEVYSLKLLPSVLIVILGVLVTVWSDRFDVHFLGLAVVITGCVFSSLKGIMTRNVQLNMDTISVLKLVCPISVTMLLIASILSGELQRAIRVYDGSNNVILAVQGVLAALLNYVSFKCASHNSPLTMNIAGNIKQVLTPLIASNVIASYVSSSGYMGLSIAFVGALWYTILVNRIRRAKQMTALPGTEKVSSDVDVSTECRSSPEESTNGVERPLDNV